MRKVALIAGHNGPGTGAKSPSIFKQKIDEGAETIWLRDEITYYLRKKYNVNVINDDNKSTLSKVINKLKSLIGKKDLSIDIHFNSFSNQNATGCEVLIPHNATEYEKKVANGLLSVIKQTLDIKSRGVKSESSGLYKKLAMLSNFDAEQVLLEICFVSNVLDCMKYNNKKFILAELLADKIFELIK